MMGVVVHLEATELGETTIYVFVSDIKVQVCRGGFASYDQTDNLTDYPLWNTYETLFIEEKKYDVD